MEDSSWRAYPRKGSKATLHLVMYFFPRCGTLLSRDWFTEGENFHAHYHDQRRYRDLL